MLLALDASRNYQLTWNSVTHIPRPLPVCSSLRCVFAVRRRHLFHGSNSGGLVVGSPSQALEVWWSARGDQSKRVCPLLPAPRSLAPGHQQST